MNAVTEKPVPLVTEQQGQESDPPRHLAVPRPRRMWRLIRPGLAAAVLIAGAVTVSWWFTEGRWIESTDNAYIQGDIAVLSPRIDGEVAKVLVRDNQRVHAGDTLIQLDPADYEARLAQARAAAAEAEAAVTTAQRQLVQQQSTIQAAEAAVLQAQAELTRASADATRSANLTASGWTSRQADELAIATSRKATAALASATAQEEAAEQQLAVLAAQLTQAHARRQNAAAAVRLAENNLSYTAIKAPFDGVVGNRAAEPGQHVSPGTQLIALAPPSDALWVTANFKETQLSQMRPGMKVRLIPDIAPGAAVDGRVESLAPATGALFSLLPPENATGNFTKVVQRVPVRIAIDPADARNAGWLRAGLSVTAEVDTRGPDAQRLGLFGVAAATMKGIVP